MSDYRAVDVAATKWFPQTRKTVPATSIVVQVPPSACTVSLLPGRYALELVLAGHAAHPGFVSFLEDVEAHARAHAKPTLPDLQWHAAVHTDALLPTFKVSAFDDTLFYTSDDEIHASPEDIRACACLVEMAGAWTSDTHWGIRWKVLEVKDASGRVLPVPCLL